MGKVNRKNWKSWRDIKEWAEAEGYKHLAAVCSLITTAGKAAANLGVAKWLFAICCDYARKRKLKI